jgi:PAS domain S-box-containing protein
MKNQSVAERIFAHLNNDDSIGYFLATGEELFENLQLKEANKTTESVLGVSTGNPEEDITLSNVLKNRLGMRTAQISKLKSTGRWNGVVTIGSESDSVKIHLSLLLEHIQENSVLNIRCTGIINRISAKENRIDESEKLLTATARANTYLLETDQLEDAIFKAFKVIGEATQVDRVYIFENYENPSTQTLSCRQRMEWSGSSLTPQIDNEDLQQFPIEEGIPRWYSTLKEGGNIQGLVKDFPREEREVLEPQDIVSLLVIPVTINEEFWGFVGFDDCSDYRSWNKSEVAILKALASNLGLRYERHRVETELEQSRTVFQQIAETIDEVFYVADNVQQVVYVNSAIDRIFGVKQKELLSDQGIFNNRIHEDDLDKIKQHISRKTSSVYEFRYNHPDGSQLIIAAKRFPVLDSQGDIERVIGVLRDVTEIKQAQLEMKANLEKEHELLELKNNFISMISHEIRTPITTIISTAEMLRDFVSKMEEEKRNEMIARVLGASRTIVNLLEDVLFIGKTDASVSKVDSRKVHIEKAIARLKEENMMLIQRENEIRASYFLHSKVLPFDENLIMHILNNLVENASKYSDMLSVIDIEVRETDDVIHIKVRDNGIGIHPEDQIKMFDPFFRSKRVAHKEGTGIGMAVVKRAVDALNGTIDVDSQPGKGTSVTVSLPQEKQ